MAIATTSLRDAETMLVAFKEIVDELRAAGFNRAELGAVMIASGAVLVEQGAGAKASLECLSLECLDVAKLIVEKRRDGEH